MIHHADFTTARDLTHDVVITDPPYSAHVHASAMSSRTGGAGPVVRDLGFASITDELRNAIIRSVERARWACVFTDFEGMREWFNACSAQVDVMPVRGARAGYIRTVPWVRWSQPQISGDRPPSGAEAVMLFHGKRPGKKRWNGPGGLTHFAARAMRGANKHPTEKPIDLALSLVSYFSDPGETVLDPCAGSGVIGVACRLLGRKYLGFEINPEWAEKAALREVSPLSDRDRKRVEEWLVYSAANDSVPEPRNASERATYARYLRRVDDRDHVRDVLAIETSPRIHEPRISLAEAMGSV